MTLLVSITSLNAQDEASPFITTPLTSTNAGSRTLTISFKVPPHHRLYADALTFELGGKTVEFLLPQPATISDKHSGGVKRVFEKDFVASRAMRVADDTTLAISLHGCNDEECFFPETRRWIIGPQLVSTISENPENRAAAAAATTAKLTDGFEVLARTTGFQTSGKFQQFLTQGTGGSPIGGMFAGMGITATIALILLGGVALNLTPCVLPMIPINLAILGAGARNGDRRRGFALGAAYGAGMAAAYGGLGLAVVITGAKFGALNSSPWFNFTIAIVFIVLALAMLDRLSIDLSRFQRAGQPRRQGAGAFAGAATMGGISALLAGACVAPVVISVLLLATTFYQQGNVAGLLLPFVLGIGMALPWPFAASGLSFLPKPGAWMTRVKHGFALVIFGFAAWYGALGWQLIRPIQVAARTSGTAEANIAALRSALEQSRVTDQPVLVDFWASWCKNCSAMEHSTLRDSGVRKQLDNFTLVKFQAEHLNDAALKSVLDEFGVIGLPTYVVLKPHRSTPSAKN